MPESTLRVGKPLGGSLEIHIECKQLANMDTFSLSDPFARLEIKVGDEWTEVGKLCNRIVRPLPVRRLTSGACGCRKN